MTKKHESSDSTSIPNWISAFPQVAHYTTYQGLFDILKDKQLWATHYRFLNDSSELEHGMPYIDQIYGEAVKSSSHLDKKQRERYLNNIEDLRDLWFSGIARKTHIPEFFFTSFCGIPPEINDPDKLGSDGLLSQWRGYGRDGGFAIVFDSLEIYQSYHRFPKNCGKHTGKSSEDCEDCKIELSAKIMDEVVYDYQDGQLENRILCTAMEHVAKVVVDDDLKYKIEDIPSQTMNDNIIGIIGTIVLTKHKGFKEEKEIRFACLNRFEKREGGYANRSPYETSIEFGAPRLKIDFSPSAIKKIIIGPQPNQEKIKVFINYYLESNDYHNVEIVSSEIPFIPR
jgi:hypothetical protein